MQKAKLIILLILLLTSIVVWAMVFSRELSGELKVSFLDVGQGDAIFIEAPNGNQVLIDGGATKQVLRALGKEMSFFDREIDVVIATHPDTDHIGGLTDVLERYDVSTFIESGNRSEEPVYDVLLERVEESGAEHVFATRGQVVNLGDGAYIRILFPDRDVTGVESNVASIVAQVVYGDTSFMLTGDSPKEIERYIVEIDGSTIQSNVLKAGHHGSQTSSSELFVGFVDPEYAVVSASCDNKYGHPHQEVLEMFQRFDVEVVSTCENGTVIFVSDGSRVSIK